MRHEEGVRRCIVVLSSVLLALMCTSAADAQATDAPELADFTLVVKTTANGIDLTCSKGCAWSTLGFPALPADPPQAVDQYGMASIGQVRNVARPGLANYLFTIQRTVDGVRLEGKRGSAWSSLAFTCPPNGCNQSVDQYGMAGAGAR